MLSWSVIVTRLSLAALFGLLIGLERGRKNWAAGLRTHMMVCVGSSLIMMVSAFGFSDILGSENIGLDPSRVAAQVVSGIGFIGAGAILLSKQGTVRGLTTAAGLWTVAAIGLATGGGLYFAAGATTIIALIILWALEPLEQLYLKKLGHITFTITTNAEINNMDLLKNLLQKEGLKIQSLTIEKNKDCFDYHVKIDRMKVEVLETIVDEIKKDDNIKDISWTL